MNAAAVAAALEHRYATVNRVRLHYVTAGEGPLMLFVHGFPEFWYEWQEQIDAFSAEFQAVAVDLRGYNLSEKPADVAQYRIGLVAADLRELITHLGHRKAIVVAHDWGGAAAWYLAARNPEVVERLVIINAPHPNLFHREIRHNPAQRAASDYTRALIDSDSEVAMSANNFALLEETFTKWAPAGRKIPSGLMAKYREAWSQPGALTGSINYYRASVLRVAGEPASVARDFVVRVPTLVIWGESDVALLPGLVRGLEEYVPDVRLERIPEGTHWVVHEFPERVNALIREFLDRGQTPISNSGSDPELR